MFEIVAFWKFGDHEVVDECKTEAEARTLASEYRLAYGAAATRIEITEIRTTQEEN
jgi:hypothetical protein